MKLFPAVALTVLAATAIGSSGCGVSTDSVRWDPSPSLYTETRSYDQQKNEEYRNWDRLERAMWTDIARLFWVDDTPVGLSTTPTY
ncbi:MAG: hypothetical protein AAGA57_07455 [Planctomycetota bacterium]